MKIRRGVTGAAIALTLLAGCGSGPDIDEIIEGKTGEQPQVTGEQPQVTLKPRQVTTTKPRQVTTTTADSGLQSAELFELAINQLILEGEFAQEDDILCILFWTVSDDFVVDSFSAGYGQELTREQARILLDALYENC